MFPKFLSVPSHAVVFQYSPEQPSQSCEQSHFDTLPPHTHRQIQGREMAVTCQMFKEITRNNVDTLRGLVDDMKLALRLT